VLSTFRALISFSSIVYSTFSGNNPGIQREARVAGKVRRSGARVDSEVSTPFSVRLETMRPACRSPVPTSAGTSPRLFADLELAHGDGRFARLFRMLVKVDLLILDDWGPDRLTASQRRDLMEIVEDRHGRGSILITSQLPVPTWHDVIGEPTLGDAILDRIVHSAYRLELDGPSMRKIKAAETSEPAATTATGDKPKGAKK
jgi:hypothetical protein